ncbi:importin beta1-2 [Pelomyxa schiedti]|nr:importin beta1-2 [Pelomyxa schiedti]
MKRAPVRGSVPESARGAAQMQLEQTMSDDNDGDRSAFALWEWASVAQRETQQALLQCECRSPGEAPLLSKLWAAHTSCGSPAGNFVNETHFAATWYLACLTQASDHQMEDSKIRNYLEGICSLTPQTSPHAEMVLQALTSVFLTLPSEVVTASATRLLTFLFMVLSLTGEAALKNAAVKFLSEFFVELTMAAFENENERTVIMNKLIELSQESSPDNTRCQALKCLANVATVHYNKLDRYMQQLFNVTSSAISKGSDEVAMDAIEFWSSLTETEITLEEGDHEESRKYVRGAFTYILPLLLVCLMKQDENSDPDDFSVDHASGCCLSLIAQYLKDDVVTPVFTFVQGNIGHTNWHNAEASLIAFGAILDGPSPSALRPFITSLYPQVVALLSHSHIVVQQSAAWTLERIFTLHYSVVKDRVQAIMPLICTMLGSKTNSNEFLFTLVFALADQDQEDASNGRSLLDPFVPALLDQLYRLSDKDGRPGDLAAEALCHLAKDCSDNCVPRLTPLLAAFVEKIKACQSGSPAAAKSYDFKFSVLNSCISRLGKTVICGPLADSLAHLLLNELRKGPGEECLMATSSLCSVLEDGFSSYAMEFLPHTLGLLRQPSEVEIFKCACGVISDISRALSQGIGTFGSEALAIALQVLGDASVERTAKPCVFDMIGDIIMHCKGPVPGLPAIVEVTCQAGSARPVDTSDDDEVDYFYSLHESVLGTYTALLQATKQIDNRSLVAAVPHILGLVRYLHQDTTRPDTISQAIAGIIGDLAQRFGSSIRSELQSANALQILADLGRSAMSDTQSVTWATKQVRKVLGS